MEGDRLHIGLQEAHQGFLSTPSAWRATYVIFWYIDRIDISIHALRMEGDA